MCNCYGKLGELCKVSLGNIDNDGVELGNIVFTSKVAAGAVPALVELVKKSWMWKYILVVPSDRLKGRTEWFFREGVWQEGGQHTLDIPF